jgi:hypothetical protein
LPLQSAPIFLLTAQNGLTLPSVAMVFQMRAIDRKRIIRRIGELEMPYLTQVDAEIWQMLKPLVEVIIVLILSPRIPMSEEYIVIVTDETEETSGSIDTQRGWRDEIQKKISSLKEVKLPVSELEQNMNQFLQLVGRLFKQVDQQIGSESDMKLDEVELAVEIGGEGEVKLVAGGKASGKGAIKLKFTRSDKK